MKRNELKDILKPLIKECIKEVIFEDGTLSGIISEVMQGLQGTTRQPIVEKKVIKSMVFPIKNSIIFSSLS